MRWRLRTWSWLHASQVKVDHSIVLLRQAPSCVCVGQAAFVSWLWQARPLAISYYSSRPRPTQAERGYLQRLGRQRAEHA